MMLQSIDKNKIYLYFFLLFILLSIHNINSSLSIQNFFKINKIIIKNNLDISLNDEISETFDDLYNHSIFSLNSNEIDKKLSEFNIISEYKIKREYPSSIKVELKQTTILAYFFDNNQKTYLGENGKRIKRNIFPKKNLPLIVGQVDIKNFINLKKKLDKNGFLLNEFDKFFFFKSKRWDLLYKGKIIVKLPIDNLDNSLIILKDIIENTNVNNYKIIDLRLKDKIILS